VRRVQDQAATLVHCSNLWRNPNQARLAAKIAEYAGPGKVFFCNSGLEANEVLLKLARLHGREKSGAEAKQFHVLTAYEAFHGRGFGGMAATPQEKIQGGFRPMLDGFKHGVLNDIDSFAKLIDEQTAAILIEPIQGEGGIQPCTREFLRGIRELCDRHGLLFLADEVQCGLGRTGQFFAFEHAGVRPDGIAMAKGLGGGFPIGAVWIDQTYASLFQPGSHGCTFGGSPLACAASLAVFEVMEKENLLHRIRELSASWHLSLQSLVEKYPALLKEVRGRGFLVALGAQDDPSPIIGKLLEAGLITVPAGGNAIRLLPPYTVKEEELQESVDILDAVLGEYE
jgi:acetylornithine aminotransferase/acetylornithine/N-succinyldiaminopimelate aminotransferase